HDSQVSTVFSLDSDVSINVRGHLSFPVVAEIRASRLRIGVYRPFPTASFHFNTPRPQSIQIHPASTRSSSAYRIRTSSPFIRRPPLAFWEEVGGASWEPVHHTLTRPTARKYPCIPSSSSAYRPLSVAMREIGAFWSTFMRSPHRGTRRLTRERMTTPLTIHLSRTQPHSFNSIARPVTTALDEVQSHLYPLIEPSRSCSAIRSDWIHRPRSFAHHAASRPLYSFTTPTAFQARTGMTHEPLVPVHFMGLLGTISKGTRARE
ncbi:hypothetical protein V8E53_012770, partial [Lactarius tabidus]